MKIFQLNVLLVVILLVNSQHSEPQVRVNNDFRRTSDRLGRPIYDYFRRWAWRATGNVKDIEEQNRKENATQNAFENMRPEYVHNFFCNVNGPGKRSERVPINVKQIRPGDIDIIGVLGDSLSSANGGYSSQLLHVINEYRSIAWSGGGRGNYSNYITLPNILKNFNPKLYGYSTGDGLSTDKSSKFNLAEPFTMSPDLLFQSKILVDRIRKDSKVDFNNHWKMITILIGNNDFCSDSCHYESYEKWVNLHETELIKSLRYLRDHMPRVIVNVVGLPNFTMTERKLKYIKHGINLWNERDKMVSNMNEFHTNDFATIYQPFLTNVNFFANEKKGIADFSYMANDCFHFSQLGQAMAALGIWQNLMEPKSNKTTNWNPNMNRVMILKCPTKEFPYIRLD